MGLYINPTDMTKEEWLNKHKYASPMEYFPRFGEIFGHYGPNNDTVLVCLVDNGYFTAAGICYNDRELQDFARDDGRRKVWYAIKRSDLKPFLHGQHVEGAPND